MILAAPLSARLRFASWNVRHCFGVDRRLDPKRVAGVLAAIDADVVAVQELDVGLTRTARADQPAFIAEELGLRPLFAKTLDLNGGAYGHALFTRLPAIDEALVRLPRIGASEPRALIDATLGIGSRSLRILATHLGLSAPERALQAHALAERLAGYDGPAAILGDLNAGPGQIGYQELVSVLRDPLGRVPLRERCTWPSPWPFRALDHVLLSPSIYTREISIVDRGAARFASDHRPVVADVLLAMDREGTSIARIPEEGP